MGAWQQFFRTFQVKAAEGKIYEIRKSAHKKRVLQHDNAQEENSRKSEGKKEFLNTIHAWGEKPWFSGQNWISGHDTRAGEKLQKVTLKKNVHQDISDTLKSRLLKNTNIHHIGWVPEQIGRTPGQAAAVSFIFLVLKKILQIPHPLKEYSGLSESIKRVCRDSQDLKRAARNRQFRQS